jgi:hypothetical protein
MRLPHASGAASEPPSKRGSLNQERNALRDVPPLGPHTYVNLSQVVEAQACLSDSRAIRTRKRRASHESNARGRYARNREVARRIRSRVAGCRVEVREQDAGCFR